MNDIQDISTSMVLPSTPWDNLSMAEKAEMMKVAVSNGITNLQDIQNKYNEFAKGGNLYDGGPVYDVLPQLLKDAGLDVRVTSGYRKPGQVGKAGSKSWHTRHGAVDIVPQGKTTFADIEHALYNNPVISDYMLSNGFGLIDESGRTAESKTTMRKTGATGAHFHIGKDSVYAKKYASKFQTAPLTQPQIVLPTELTLPSIPTSPTLPIEYTPVYYPEAETTTTAAIPTNPYNEAALAAEEKRNRLNTLNLILSMTNNNGQNDSFLNTLSMLNNIPYAAGGKIHIKPENRGKFTALKERTGHSATWFKQHGTPAQKKMATFALNAKHWKHGLGGNLFDGESEPTQKLQIGLNVKGWKPYSLDDILVNAEKIQAQKNAMEEALTRKANDYLTTSNDATSIANGRQQNQHLTERAIEGAKTHRAWEEEHPVATQWENVLGAVPLAVAAYPFAASVVGSGLASAGNSLAALTANTFPRLYTISKNVLPWADRIATGYFGYQGAKDVAGGNFSPFTALDLMPLAGKIWEQASRVPTYKRLEKNYTGVPHNQSKDVNGNLLYNTDGTPVYMDESFPFVHKSKTIWTADDVDYAKNFATPDKPGQPIGTIFDVYTDAKNTSILDTPTPAVGESFYWQGLPFESRNGKLVVAKDVERVKSGVAKDKETSILKGGEPGTYSQDELSSAVFKSKDVGTINWDKNPTAIKTDDIVDFSRKHGYNATRFHQIQDGPSKINGEWHYYPIDELVLNPGATSYILPHGAPKYWLWNQLPKKKTLLSNSLFPLSYNILNNNNNE